MQINKWMDRHVMRDDISSCDDTWDDNSFQIIYEHEMWCTKSSSYVYMIPCDENYDDWKYVLNTVLASIVWFDQG